MNAAPSTHLLTPSEAASIARVSRRTIERRIASGELATVRIGSGPRARVRILPGSFARFLAAGSTDDEAGIAAFLGDVER